MPKFAARHNDLELLAIVRDVARAAEPADPRTVAGRRWDDHRARAGRAGAPGAASIARRFGLSWRDVLRVAHADPNDALRRLNNLRADKGRKGFDLAAVMIALRQAAVRLGSEQLDRSDYERARAQILKPSRRTPQRTVVERAIPSVTQVDEVLRQNDMTWAAALRRAGLAPATKKGAGHIGMPLAEAIAAFVDDVSMMPATRQHLVKWAAARGVSIEGRDKAAPVVLAAISEFAVARDRDGLPTLPVAKDGMRFTGLAPADASHGPRARRFDWNRESLIAGMATATELLPPGEPLNQRALKRLAAEHPALRIPSYSTVNRHLRVNHPDESWEEWRQEAQRYVEGRARRR